MNNTSNTPLVTIGIPLYNEAKYILNTIESAVNQTYTNIEIIISDNCSTDTSLEVIDGIVQQNSNIQLIKHTDNIGATDNFNFLKKVAKGKYFMWLGAHDIISKNYIENSIKVLEQNLSIVMVYHNSVFFSDTVTLENLQDDAGSPIDTTNFNHARNRMYKVVSNLSYCTAIHGVFRTKILNKNLLENIIGPDNLLLFATAEFGHIKRIPKIGFYRRDINLKEGREEKLKRYKDYKIISPTSIDKNNLLFVGSHIKYILNSNILTSIDKIKLLRNIINLFSKTHHVSKIVMLTQVITHFFIKNK